MDIWFIPDVDDDLVYCDDSEELTWDYSAQLWHMVTFFQELSEPEPESFEPYIQSFLELIEFWPVIDRHRVNSLYAAFLHTGATPDEFILIVAIGVLLRFSRTRDPNKFPAEDIPLDDLRESSRFVRAMESVTAEDIQGSLLASFICRFTGMMDESRKHLDAASHQIETQLESDQLHDEVLCLFWACAQLECHNPSYNHLQESPLIGRMHLYSLPPRDYYEHHFGIIQEFLKRADQILYLEKIFQELENAHFAESMREPPRNLEDPLKLQYLAANIIAESVPEPRPIAYFEYVTLSQSMPMHQRAENIRTECHYIRRLYSLYADRSLPPPNVLEKIRVLCSKALYFMDYDMKTMALADDRESMIIVRDEVVSKQARLGAMPRAG